MMDNCVTGGKVCGNYYNNVSNGYFIRICWAEEGFIIAILTLVFHIPIHVALATSLTAMAFTTLSGVVSHYREGNVALIIGGIVGDLAQLALILVLNLVHLYGTSSSLVYSRDVIFIGNFMFIKLIMFQNKEQSSLYKHKEFSMNYLLKCICLGLVTGMMVGSFGIGSAPFIQLGLMVLLGLTIQQSVGTTMLVILPIAIGGGLGYSSEGYLDYILLLQVLIGTMLGAYIGAKFTNYAPRMLLRFSMIMTPVLAGCMLLME